MNIRRILKEDKKTKSTNKEFSKYKDSKFNSLRDYTLQDIVDNWDSLSDHKNENIKTIKHFINNPDKITDLVYDENGLEDGYHRLIAAKILKKPRFSYRLVENLQENIRRILKEETTIKETVRDMVKSHGFIITSKMVGSLDEVHEILELKGTQEDMLFIVNTILKHDLNEPMCNFVVSKTLHSIKTLVNIPLVDPDNPDFWTDEAIETFLETKISDMVYKLGKGLVRGNNINVSAVKC